MITIQEVKTAILSGKFSQEEITEILMAIRGRKDIVAGEFKRTLREGQTVWFNDTTKPTYLQGQELEIIKVNRERVVVRLKNKSAGGRFQGDIRSTVSLLTATKPPYAVPVPKQSVREPFSITKKDAGQMPGGIA